MAETEKTKKKGKKGLVTAIVTVMVIALTALAIFLINGTKKNSGGGMPGGRGGWGGGQGGNTVYSVKSVVATPVLMRDFLNTNGNVETETAIEVFPSIGGKVIQMNVSLGSQVKGGEVIAYIDPSEPGSYYAKSPVTAPISGSIISSPVKTGQKVTVSSVITKIGDIDNLQISANVPERYVADLKIGLKAEITLEAYPDVIFNASVVRISPVLDSATRTKEIILNFDEKDSRVNAGMFAKVKLFTVEYPNQISIQQDAFITQNDSYYLYVVKDDDTVERRTVTIGKNIDGYYQVTSGIEEGERVAVEGILSLFDGAKVNDISK